ncbi:hypothetical protein [Nocardioides lianchengensis]|uniref:DUF4064 domain-containing protein n=1 Tax=Nocardioides lianchengensis TaxID=1045774 RepID=A0A1G6Y0I3_9ACTN|nr:hypothetical protein [Nocardioides lianchengensis]NYG13514.1 hypothetical protein [Nocardioides lianchengensis]SDD83984.1 hypothetical protein SAMN05421872_111160 [Nocardioides lianchengensis]
MSSPTRPRQATFAAGLIIGGSVLLVLSAFDSLSGLQSLEMRDAAEEFLSRPFGDGLGIDVDGVLGLLRVLTMIAAATATAMAVLGGYVLQRSRPARLALSVLAPVLAVTGLVSGGIFAPVVTVAVVMLWLQPARDWFDGIERRPEPERAPDRKPSAVWPPPTPPTPPAGPAAPPSSSEPRAYPGFGAAPQPGFPLQAPQPGAPASYPTYGAPQPGPYGAPRPSASARPPAVLWACVVAWSFSGLVAGMMLITALVVGLAPDLVLEEVRRRDASLADDLTDDRLAATAVVAVVLVLWSVVAAVFTWFAFRRARWGQVALLVSAGLAGAFCLVGVAVGSFPLVLPMAGCVAAFALLMRPEVRAWYAGRGTI